MQEKGLKYETVTIDSENNSSYKNAHLSKIQEYRNKYKNLLFLDENSRFKDNITNLNVPKNWSVIHLGGCVINRSFFAISNGINIKYNEDWIKARINSNFAYAINLTQTDYIEQILEKNNVSNNISLEEFLNLDQNIYMKVPMMVSLRDYLPSLKAHIGGDDINSTLEHIKKAEYSLEDNNYILKLPDISDEELPYVSILTPTLNKRKMFGIAMRNFLLFDYPPEKLEWVIVDDGNDELTDILPRNDHRIKYIKINNLHDGQNLPVGKKRNLCAEYASYKYLVHMDDDDYYPPESIKSRIKTLIKYKSEGIECVGCNLIGTYNLLNNTSYIASDGHRYLTEASLAYTKSFWARQNFDNDTRQGEFLSFLYGRYDKIINIPFHYVLIAFTNPYNITGNLRSNKKNKNIFDIEDKVANFYDIWDIDTQIFVDDLRHYIKMDLSKRDLNNQISL